jgi:hypothetical protein
MSVADRSRGANPEGSYRIVVNKQRWVAPAKLLIKLSWAAQP